MILIATAHISLYNKTINVCISTDRPTSKLFINVSLDWSFQSHSSESICACHCMEGPLLQLLSVLGHCSAAHQHRDVYRKQDEWDESRLLDQQGSHAFPSPAEQMFRTICWQLLEEEKVQKVCLNRGLMNWLTHLPKWPKFYMSTHS